MPPLFPPMINPFFGVPPLMLMNPFMNPMTCPQMNPMLSPPMVPKPSPLHYLMHNPDYKMYIVDYSGEKNGQFKNEKLTPAFLEFLIKENYLN